MKKLLFLISFLAAFYSYGQIPSPNFTSLKADSLYGRTSDGLNIPYVFGPGQKTLKVNDTLLHVWGVHHFGGSGEAVWGSITGTLSNQTDLQTALGGKANSIHGHVISDVTGLQTALDGKASTTHTHTESDITDLGNYLESVDIADINATGTPSSSTYLRGDGTWQTVSTGGINNIVEDISPQLGGNLDVQTFNIEGATASDLVKLSQLTATSTELNHVDGVTSNIQTQLDSKLNNNAGNNITTSFNLSNSGIRWETVSTRTGIYSPTSGSNRYGFLLINDKIQLYNQNGIGGDIELRFSYLDGSVLDAGYISVNQSSEYFSFYEGGGTLTNVKAADPVEDDDVVTKGYIGGLRTKVINIGDWNMQLNSSLSVAHGLTLANIRTVQVMIRTDSDIIQTHTPFNYDPGGGAGGRWNCDASNVNMAQNTVGSIFDSSSYNDTSYNRGWIIIEYVE